jgi:tripartite-type tricarboxylate transporter receptor subunit TctC
MSEAGIKGLSIVPWGALFGPAKMPRDIVDRLSREMNVLLARPEVKEAFGKLAFEPHGSTPEALAAHLKTQVEVWKQTVQQVGIKPE